METKLRIGLMEPDKNNAELIKTFFDSQKQIVDHIEIIQSKEDLFKKIDNDTINTLIINIFNHGVLSGIDLIKEVLPQKEKTIPICLLGTEAQLTYLDGVPDEWKKKFSDYCKIIIDASPQDLHETIGQMSKSLFRCRKEKILKKQVKDIHANDNKTDKEKLAEISKVVKQSFEIVSTQGKEGNEPKKSTTLASVSDDELPTIINTTLKKTSGSIELYKWVNFAIIAVGLLLVIVAFGAFLKTGKVEVLGFGGLGLAGIIASLITNPVASIGKTARQMIHIQISYFGFLEQTSMLNRITSIRQEDVIAKSERLEQVTNSLQKSLSDCFDSPSQNKNSQDNPQNKTE